jgi:hypothetical protein
MNRRSVLRLILLVLLMATASPGAAAPLAVQDDGGGLTGSVQIVPLDQNGKILPDVCYNVTDYDFIEDVHRTKDHFDKDDGTDGSVFVSDLFEGTVEIVQISGPDNCTPQKPDGVKVQVERDSTTDVNLYDDCQVPTGSLDIYLQEPNGAAIGGGCFDILQEGVLVDHGCDDGDGVAHFEPLPIGNLSVIQTSSPQGYLCCETGAAYVDGKSVAQVYLVNERIPATVVSLTPTLVQTPTQTPIPPRIKGLLLNEVLFLPPPGEWQFVEIKNSSGRDIALDGITLLNRKKKRFWFPAGLPPLAPGKVLLIVFDGRDRLEGATLHADRTDFLGTSSDVITLRDPSDRRLDRVAWGERLPDAVNLSRGGFAPAPEPGTTIGRLPGSTDASNRLEWIVYSPSQTSPGADNPFPVVEVLLPPDGAIFDVSSIQLSWYVVPGSSHYRIQVAGDPSFAVLMADAEVVSPPFTIGSLSSGLYYLRVQAVAPDGSMADFSKVSSFEIRQVQSARSNGPRAFATTARAPVALTLEVPFVLQRKDTALLLLESDYPSPHDWDDPHPDYDPNDPADNMNCALAAAAMISAFFGGEVSEDWLGYIALREAGYPDSPKDDLNFGRGLGIHQVTTALSAAVGVDEDDIVSDIDPIPLDLWESVFAEISAGRPLLVGQHDHIFVVVGYNAYDPDDPTAVGEIKLLDPSGATSSNLPLASAYIGGAWYLRRTPPPFFQDARVSTDQDNNGVMDFDEELRFHTDPANADSDGDGVPDKRAICVRWMDPAICERPEDE